MFFLLCLLCNLVLARWLDYVAVLTFVLGVCFILSLCSYMREKEMEEELMQQRREEEGKGKERRKALLEKEERRRREVEASVISSVPDVGTKEAIAMAAAVRAVGGDVLFDDSKAGEDILRRIFLAQRARRAQEVSRKLAL